MSDQLVVDSSISFKWYLQENEPDSDRAWELLESHRAGTLCLCAPTLMRLELLNALKSRGRDERQLSAALKALEQARIRWYPVDAELSAGAVGVAVRFGLTLYDAAFAALALQLDCELVTADRRLAESGACRVRLLG